jgi:hypothetical protein
MMGSKNRRQSMALILPLVAILAYGQTPARYRHLQRVINNNAGFAHATRGMNMYTLIALRSCVTEKDIPILAQMLNDHDRITRMTSANVLVDLGKEGKQAVRAQLNKTTDPSERIIMDEALTESASPEYRPILQYPLTETERGRIRGCGTNSH